MDKNKIANKIARGWLRIEKNISEEEWVRLVGWSSNMMRSKVGPHAEQTQEDVDELAVIQKALSETLDDLSVSREISEQDDREFTQAIGAAVEAAGLARTAKHSVDKIVVLNEKIKRALRKITS